MLMVFIFINPVISQFNRNLNMITGLCLQGIALILLITIPPGSFGLTILYTLLYALGFSIFRPFIDCLFAEVTEGKDRAGIYSFVNAAICLSSAIIGFVSGYIYTVNPQLIYAISIALLFICITLLVIIKRQQKNEQVS